MSLCFKAAALAKKKHDISETEYLRHLISHLRGVRHAEDEHDKHPDFDSEGCALDVFTRAFRHFAIQEKPQVVQDIGPYERLFQSCLVGNIDAVRSELDDMNQISVLPNAIQPLAVFAASKSHAAILQLCLDNGAIFDKHLDDAAWCYVNTPAMLDVLHAANWRNIQNSSAALSSLEYRAASQSPEMLTWLIDHGVSLSPGIARRSSYFSLPVLRVIVQQCGVESLKGSGTLQLAAYRGDQEKVAYLLRAGADPNDRPPSLDEREGPHPGTALHEALCARHLGIAQLLLDHDADIDGPVSRHSQRSIIQDARDRGDDEGLKILVQEQEKRESFLLIRI